MKMKKHLLVVSMLLICILTLVGCSGTESATDVLKKSQEKEKQIESVTATADMNMEMTSNGQTVEMKSSTDMILFTKSYKTKMHMAMDMGELGKQEAELYSIKDDDAYTTYTNASGEWFKQSVDKEVFEQAIKDYDNSAYTKALLECEKDVTFEEVEEDGKKYYKFTGTITGDALKKMIDSTNLKEQLASSGATDISSYDKLGNLKLVVFIEKDSYYIYKVSIDMTNMMDKLMSEVMKEAGSKDEVKIDTCTMNTKYTDYNNSKDFKLPKEAENAQELQVPTQKQN